MLSFLKMMLTPEFFFSILRISAPILFATLGAIVVEKAGFCNIGLEGIMMFAALTGSLVSYYAGSWFWGLLAALAMGTLMGLMMGFFAFQLKTDITLVGIAVNMMGSGGTLFLCKVITNLTEGKAMASSTGLITSTLCVPNITIPLLNKIPFLGGVLSGHSLLTYLAFIICGLTSVMLYKTSLGMNIRAVGENPNAAASVGVSVLKIKYTAIAYSGLMAGFGGAFMSMSYAAGWSLDMVAGRGFIALAAQAMGSGECLGGMLSSLVFGFAQALGIKFSARGLDSNLASPIPYAVTIIGLVVFALVRRSRIRLSAKKRPASFIFVGPTGVGKTELVKVLSEELFDNVEPLIRLDMSEFMEKHSVSRIIGSPPGYVGYDEAGQLTEKVRRRPYSIVLFDEIEKAHPDVMNILLQILDEGRITDAQGRQVSFENTIIIMTSNAGSERQGSALGFDKTRYDDAKDKAETSLRQFLRPEFLARVDEVVVFRPLTEADMQKIAALMLEELKKGLAEREIKFGWDEGVLRLAAAEAYGHKSGARDLRNVLRRRVEDPICTLLAGCPEQPPALIHAEEKDGEIVLVTA